MVDVGVIVGVLETGDTWNTRQENKSNDIF